MENEKKVKKSVAREKKRKSAKDEKMRLLLSVGSERNVKRNETIKVLWHLRKVKD